MFMTIFLTVIVIFVTILLYVRRWIKRTTFCQHQTDLRGKVAIVTGSNSGIGKETARELAKRGARVILACRNSDKAKAAADEIRCDIPGSDLVVKYLDLSRLETVTKFAQEVIEEENCVDILINNAGVGFVRREILEEGLEYTVVSNHLGHFLLTNLLLDVIEKSQIKRVVIVSGDLYIIGRVKFDNDGELINAGRYMQYFNTKLMNCLFARELNCRVNSKGISVFVVTPGVVSIGILRPMFGDGFGRHLKVVVEFILACFTRTSFEGCQTSVYCAVAPDLEPLSGMLFTDCNIKPWDQSVIDSELASRLWKYSEMKVKRFL